MLRNPADYSSQGAEEAYIRRLPAEVIESLKILPHHFGHPGLIHSDGAEHAALRRMREPPVHAGGPGTAGRRHPPGGRRAARARPARRRAVRRRGDTGEAAAGQGHRRAAGRRGRCPGPLPGVVGATRPVLHRAAAPARHRPGSGRRPRGVAGVRMRSARPARRRAAERLHQRRRRRHRGRPHDPRGRDRHRGPRPAGRPRDVYQPPGHVRSSCCWGIWSNSSWLDPRRSGSTTPSRRCCASNHRPSTVGAGRRDRAAWPAAQSRPATPWS